MVVAQFWPIVGGAENQARRLAAQLRRDGVEVEVWTGRWSRDARPVEEVDDVLVRRLGPGLALRPVRLRRWLFALALFSALLRRGGGFDVFHVHQVLYPAFVAALAGRLLGKPVLARISSTGSTGDLDQAARGGVGLQRFLTRRLLSRIVAVNRQAERDCLAHGYRPQQVVRIPNGVAADATPVRAPGRELRALYVGGLRREKRLEVLLAAWEQAGSPGTLALVGEGRERARLEARAARSGGVVFAGAADDVRPFYAQADTFVLSSDAEGMSNALLEAMAASCACVATHVGGNVDLLDPDSDVVPDPGSFRHGRAGLLVRVGDAAGLAAALRRLADDPPLRAGLGAAARERCHEGFLLEDVARRYEDLYRDLVGAR